MSRFVPAPNLADVLDGVTVADREQVAEQVIDTAARVSRDDTGDYDRSLHVLVDGDRVIAGSTDPAGHIIEWGRDGQSPQAPIRTGATEAGRFEPK